MAMWKAEYVVDGTDTSNFLYFSAADAKSMKRAHLTTAVKNARKRAKARLAKQGLRVRVHAVNCVG